MAEGLLSAGAGQQGPADWREAQRGAAATLADLCSGGYGPHGAAKLVVAHDGEARWVRSAALALRECGTGPLLAPYVDLASRLHRHSGDQVTGAVLLAARLVQAALAEDAPAPAQWLDGYRLAHRQARAWLAAHVQPAPADEALGAVAPGDWVRAAVAGVPALTDGRGELDLGRVDVRAEAGAESASWLDGVVVEPQEPPPASAPGAGADGGAVRVLLLRSPWSVKPRSEGLAGLGVTARDPGMLAGMAAAEERRRAGTCLHVQALGATFLACAAGLDDDLKARLRSAGVTVWTDAPLTALERLARTTRATLVTRLEDARPSDLGRGRLERRPRRAGWLLSGGGPSATFVVPGGSSAARDAAVEQAESLLRATGLVLARPGAIPGGGRWQRELAASLRSASDAGPRHTPIAMRAAAGAIDALADDLLRNAGRDVLAGGLVPGAADVQDAAACVRLAVDGAFETALAVLRLDGAYARRPSTSVGLRGGTGRAGSPKGMPGDLPPLM